MDLLERDRFDEADPQTIVQACAAYIDLLEDRGVPSDDERTAHDVGHLLALGMVRRLGWELAFVTSPAMPEGGLAVVSPDRSLMAYPPMAVYRILATPAPNVLQLTVHMLAAGNAPPSAPGAYVVVMS